MMKKKNKNRILYLCGFIEKNREPRICTKCFSRDFKYKTTDTINSIVCKQELLCPSCNKIYGYYAYGYWEFKTQIKNT